MGVRTAGGSGVQRRQRHVSGEQKTTVLAQHGGEGRRATEPDRCEYAPKPRSAPAARKSASPVSSPFMPQPPACLHSSGIDEVFGRGGGRCAAASPTLPATTARAGTRANPCWITVLRVRCPLPAASMQSSLQAEEVARLMCTRSPSSGPAGENARAEHARRSILIRRRVRNGGIVAEAPLPAWVFFD